MSNSKGNNPAVSRRTVGTPSYQRITSKSRGINDPKPLRRTPGVEDDDEIANYMEPEPTPRVRDSAPSVAGTEHQSIVEKMDWRQMKGLYDLVSRQKDEASRGSTNMVIDASRFHGGSDIMSDLSDNTSMETNQKSRVATAAPSLGSKTGSRPGVTQTSLSSPMGGVQQLGLGLGDPSGDETEYLSSIVNNVDSLSVNALEGLVSYLNQVLHVKTRGDSDTSHIEALLGSGTSDEFLGKEHRCNSSAMSNHSPDSRQTPQTPMELPQTSPYMLSQSAPSSLFFAGAAPLAATMNQTKRWSPYRSREGVNTRTDHEDEDEEIKSLSSRSNDEKPSLSVNASAVGTSGYRRTMSSTPSPKPRRSFTTTPPTKTPPMRSGAIPPVPYLSMDSDSGIATMSSAPNLSLSARTTPRERSLKRNSESPIVISSEPGVSSAVLPVVIRKDNNCSGHVIMDPFLKISVPEKTTSTKKPRYYQNSQDITKGHPNRNGSRGLHMSPNCAFEDCSVNSGSSASYYSSNHQ